MEGKGRLEVEQGGGGVSSRRKNVPPSIVVSWRKFDSARVVGRRGKGTEVVGESGRGAGEDEERERTRSSEPEPMAMILRRKRRRGGSEEEGGEEERNGVGMDEVCEGVCCFSSLSPGCHALWSDQ